MQKKVITHGLCVFAVLLTVFLAALAIHGGIHAEATLGEDVAAWIDTNGDGSYDSSTDIACATYKEALTAVTADGQTIYLTQDCYISTGYSSVIPPYSCTIDLGGYTIQSQKYVLTVNTDKQITVKNGTIYGSYKNTSGSHAMLVMPGATLTLDNVKLYNGGTYDGTAYPGKTAVAVGSSVNKSGTGNVILKNDSYVYTAGASSDDYAIGALFDSANITLSDSHVASDSTRLAIYAKGSATLTMDADSSVSAPTEALLYDETKCTLTELEGYCPVCEYDSEKGAYVLTMKIPVIRYESADKTQVEETASLAAALAMVNDDGDTITLLEDLALDGTTAVYRIDVNYGFTLDLNGKVLSVDRSLLRFMKTDTETEATLTIRNGTVVCAVGSSAQHAISIYNHGSLVLEDVEVYCGAYYTDGQVTVNQTEVDKSSNGVSAVLMACGAGSVSIKDSVLCTFGSYHAVNTYNTDETIEMSEISVSNSTLITKSAKQVFGNTDGRAYTVRFLDEKTTLITQLATNGAGGGNVNFVACDGYGMACTGPVTTDGTDYYHYVFVSVCTATWLDYDGTVLATRTDVPTGTTPDYAGTLPVRPADDTSAYAFSGWTSETDAATGNITFTATYIPLPLTYQTVTLDLIDQPTLYKTQGRTYLTDDGLNLDFAGSTIEFTAQCGGALYMTYTSETNIYYQVSIDGKLCDRVYAAKGSGLTVLLEDCLPAGQHKICVIRDSDITKNGEAVAVSSISFTGEADTLKAVDNNELVIEFVGDSITAGKYTAMEYGSDPGIHKATNSYAFLTAQALGADYSIVARGGCGYFRVSSCPVPAHKLYPYYNGFRDEPVEYTPSRQADVVVLALGTNDTAASVTESYENGTVPFDNFQAGVEYVIGQIRQMHGQDVKIVLLHNMMTSSWETEIRAAAEAQGVYFLQVTQDRTGGNNHPSAEGHQVIAQELTAFLTSTVLDPVSVCGGDTVTGYRSLQEAVNALQDGQYVRLNTDVTEDIVISGNVYLDLNGCTLTGSITGDGTLYGMDSATDDYTTENMGRVTGTVTCNVAVHHKTDVTGLIRRYMAISDDTGYTFHRFYLGVTHMSLKPTTVGVGYKAMFWGDEMVAAQLDSFGFTMCLEGNDPVSVSKTADSFVSGKVITLRVDDFDVERFGETELHACAMLKLTDGTVIESSAYSFTLRQLLEKVAADTDSYTEDQLSAVRTMVQEFSDAMSEWAIDSLR